MWLRGLIIILLVFSLGCSHAIKSILPVETETKQGESIVITELPKTADRDDIPVGWKPSDVAVKITTESGAKIYIPKNKAFSKKKLPAMNKQAIEDIKTGKLKAELPKKSYAFWYWLGGITIFLIIFNIVLVKTIGFNPIALAGGWIARIFRSKK